MSSKHPPIAIVGLGALFPGSTDANGMWRDIVAGKDQLTEIPKAHWLIDDYYDADPKAPDKTYARRGGFIPEVAFDPLEHGMPPNVIPATDTSQLLGLIVAKQLLEDATAGQFPDALRERTSVIIGITSALELLVEMGSRLQRPIWVRALREHGLPEDEVQKVCDRISGSYTPWQENTFPGLLGNVVAGRIANRLNLGGTNCVVDAACASAFGALAMGVQELHLGSSDFVITGGVETFNDIFMFMCFSKTTALSFSGDCRPFDAKSDGTMLGEGIGLIGLRRLEDAERDGNPIYAVIKGVGSSSDGRAKSIYAPVSAGQAKALRRAYDASGFGPETVELVEAHGTGTKAGDAAEFGGLQTVFSETSRKDTQWCALGSIKSQIGHTKAAAGAAGLLKATLALHNKILPPTIKIDTPNPALKIEETAFYLNAEAKPWVRDRSHPRRAGVSSFGFGGSNFHITLEEYTGRAKIALRMRTLAAELVALSAKDPASLIETADAVLTDLKAGASLSGIAQEAANRFDPSADCRLAIVASSTEDLEKQIGLVRPKIDGPSFTLPGGPAYGRGRKTEGSVAFLFPGQGSQAVGMGRDLAMAFDRAREVWDDHASLEFGDQGQKSSVHRMVFPPSVFSDEARAAQTARLTATEWAQPALGLASLATLRLLRHLGVDGDVFGGHSFGEVTALHAGGAIDATSMLQTARKRGELMRDAATTSGAMWAVALGKQTVEELEALLKEPVVIANRNSKKQVVIAGPTEAVNEAAARLKTQGFKGTRLPVATAFHSSVVAGSVDPFASFLKSQPISVPKKPVYANSTAQRYGGGEDGIRATLAAQIASSVRFSEEIETMYADGVRLFVEVGPGAVLTGLVKDTLGDLPHLAVATDRKGSNGATTFLQALGTLSANGLDVKLARLFEGTRVEARKEAPKSHAIMLSGANYAKPYPPREGSSALPKPNPPRKAALGVSVAVGGASDVVAPMAFKEEQRDVTPNANIQDPEWLRAFAEVQRQTAEAHSAYQRSMADAHMAFLRTSEAAIASISGRSLSFSAESVRPDAVATPAPFAAPSFTPAPQVPLAKASVAVQAPPLPQAMPAPVAVAPLSAKPAAGTAPPESLSITEALLAVVADKTGYPKDMIGLDMEIEADLGIDSIKRVEILSAVQERVPSLPAIPAAELGAMRTLRNILDRFGASVDVAVAVAAAVVPAAAAPTTIQSVLLSVVADKTGYPKDMIGLDMEIEADLGIDSIKRVEILSAVQEQVPSLPAIPAAELGALRTLRQILERLGGSDEAPPTHVAQAAAAVIAESSTPPARTAPAATKLGRFVAVRRPAQRPAFSPRGLFSGAVLIVRDSNGIADRLVAILEKRGVEATAVDTVDKAPALKDATSRSAARVIDLSALWGGQSDDEAIRVQKEIFETAREVARSTEGPRLFIAVADLFGASPNAEWTGGIAGLIRTMALEIPEITSRFISIAKGRLDADRLAQIVATEILEGGADLEIAVDSSGNRTAPFYEDAPATSEGTEGPRTKLEDGSVLLVSGGARGVTAACLEELAKTGTYKIAILGRTDSDLAPAWAEGKTSEGELQAAFIAAERAAGHTPTPTEAKQAAQSVAAARETRATLLALRSSGSEALYLPCDLKDEGDVNMAVGTVRSHFKRIDGVIHAAGVLADKKIAEKTDAQFNSVFDTKVKGLRNLLAATRNDDLKVLCFFGSVAGRVGNPGQADYAMANETLESVAQFEAKQRKNANVRVLHWGPWDGGMVTPSLRAVFVERGVALIPIGDGARMFVDAITDPRAPISVVVGGRPDASVLLGPGAARKVVGDLIVSSATSPHLASHAVKGVPVFPVALALEAFARIARSARPDLRLSALKDLRVLKGIRIEDFAGKGTRLEISCEQVANGSGARLNCELRSPGGPIHYRAKAEMTDRSSPKASPHEFEAPKNGTPWATDEVYGPVLFHGPDFQVLKGVRSVGPQGGSALVASTRDIGWIGGPFATDPAAIDGGLQMAILMGMRALGKTSLPTSVESLTIHIDEPTSGPLHCSIRSRSVSDLKTVSDAIVRTEDGRLLCELRGIEMHMVDTAAKA